MLLRLKCRSFFIPRGRRAGVWKVKIPGSDWMKGLALWDQRHRVACEKEAVKAVFYRLFKVKTLQIRLPSDTCRRLIHWTRLLPLAKEAYLFDIFKQSRPPPCEDFFRSIIPFHTFFSPHSVTCNSTSLSSIIPLVIVSMTSTEWMTLYDAYSLILWLTALSLIISKLLVHVCLKHQQMQVVMHCAWHIGFSGDVGSPSLLSLTFHHLSPNLFQYVLHTVFPTLFPVSEGLFELWWPSQTGAVSASASNLLSQSTPRLQAQRHSLSLPSLCLTCAQITLSCTTLSTEIHASNNEIRIV